MNNVFCEFDSITETQFLLRGPHSDNIFVPLHVTLASANHLRTPWKTSDIPPEVRLPQVENCCYSIRLFTLLLSYLMINVNSLDDFTKICAHLVN